jgi:hypothetical protein
MSIESNKKQMGRFVTFINTADPALAEELVDPSAKFHVPFKEEPLIGPPAYLMVVKATERAGRKQKLKAAA